ncbi:MAG: hypothetical protein MUF33_05805 [Candidatus Nanopelagicales bacterium]|jgi:hypothetical protein|nr:hypothetical protein [Candidatus Nanopelagicales bacterium]
MLARKAISPHATTGSEVAGRDLDCPEGRLVALGERTSAAFDPLVERARRRGQLHAGVTTYDFLLALQMAQVGLADGRSFDRVTGILLRGLFRSL